ncbi:hypothetical protein CLI92_13690 [Vandammella animalimorsus]|uniref:VOC domain-containing protein n=1 Tax=Vandammella animalimorsus TaxID=2029117 RepID=A0A2A2T236_9BURK|nr:VOC family protein [Vandammella animalimorsus]PAT31015.1 hypothetical protein CK626_12340 [Vandammella animalimorsus]PAX15545.1 hypothetical protein CLI92_13690 [Vandammella animalimorsus]PAX17298.1 hypothetical protein CLI93_13800 [Vandammella animalimorsus]
MSRMAHVTQINLVVDDLERSRVFYAALGCELRAITLPSDETPRAWVVTCGFAPLAIHTAEFAAWWDPSAPTVNAGATIIDVTFDAYADAARFIETVRTNGGRLVQELTDMPWGQSYAIFTDPDGYRWGVKTTPAQASAPDASS